MPNKVEYSLSSSLEIKEPKKYKVLLINDDFTTMDFVVNILKNLFHKSQLESTNIMLDIHSKGKAVCGVFSYEVAHTKVEQIKHIARKAGYPLRAIFEEE